jgi:tetratricopeptide (TPR) repeat protein
VSVSTVAAPIQPDRARALLPESRPERFTRSDFIAAAIVFGVTFLVYLLTLAPSVTLQDSGELITGAADFGVPHPPGYPLWTMSGYLFSHLIPFGNVAWRVNLQSAVFGAAANAVLTLLVCHSGRWLAQRWAPAEQQPLARRWMFYIGMLAGCVIGFSDVMWSQGVIAEVYTLNGLFVNLVLLFFYFWMLEPRKTHRLVIAVFVFALGLTNHHTLIQMIPAMLIAAALIQWLPFFLNVKSGAERGLFWSVLTAVNLFSLSILVFLSWIATSNTEQLRQISFDMAVGIFALTAIVSFFYLREFRPGAFAAGSAIAAAFFAYGNFFMNAEEGDDARYGPFNAPFLHWGSYVHSGWLQITTGHGIFMLVIGMIAVGLLWTSTLNRRMVFGVFAAGWVGLLPYSYEWVASSTHPPMNWGVPASRSGFYYAVTRLQYPMSLPNLIMDTIGKAIGAIRPDAVQDAGISNADYGHRLWLTLYYYGDNLQDNFTVPLIFLTLAILLYIARCDWRQVSWFVFLICAFFTLGFMLHVISPPMRFDFQNNLNYNVFNLQSHCIFVILLGYGALAAVLYLHEMVPDVTTRFGPGGLGVPAMCLALLPLWSNFNDGNQANHWFGYEFGHDVMAPMDRNAVYYGGSDFGRVVPTFMAFVESQQPARWKRDPGFDRRDVFVITQNALCDSYYTQYIRQQYDPRFRPIPRPPPSGQSPGYDQSKTDFHGDERYFTPFEEWLGRDTEYPRTSVLCLSPDELNACWSEYLARPEVIARIKSGEAGRNGIRPGSNDVFDVNGIAAEKIFQKNKASHTFYLEQSIPMDWTYPYMLPSGLIFKLSPNKLAAIPPADVAADHVYWDAYAAQLLADPTFRVDDDATLTFGKLAFNHSDLYRWRNLKSDEEYFLKLALKLSPQLQDAVMRLEEIYLDQHRYDEALVMLKQAQIDDPRNDLYADLVSDVQRQQAWAAQEKKLRGDLAISPYDLAANLQLAKLLQEEGKTAEVEDRLRTAAALTNWNHDQMVDVVQYYVEQAHNTPAAIAFLQQRAKFDPGDSKLTYSLAALEGSVGRTDEAIHDLALAAEAADGTNALMSAAVDQRFGPIQRDPRFQLLLNASTNAVTAAKTAQQVLAMPTNAPPKTPAPAKPLPPMRNAPPLHPATNAAPLRPATNDAPLLAKKPKA